MKVEEQKQPAFKAHKITTSIGLQLDNLVYNRHGEVHRIGYMDFRAWTHPQMGGDYGFYGIELSEDWLIRMSKSTEIFHEGVMIYKFGVFNVYKQGNTIWVAEGLNHGRMFEHIKSVHQLQNLYYSLVGEELSLQSI